VARLVLKCQQLGERSGSPVSTLDSTIHKSKEVSAGVLAGKLQPAAESGFGATRSNCKRSLDGGK